MSYARAIDTATIPSAGTTSDAKTIPTKKILAGVQMPAAFTGTALTFQASNDSGATWVDVYDGSTAYSLTVAPSRYHAVKPEVFFGIGLLRVVSGSSEAASRDVTLVYVD